MVVAVAPADAQRAAARFTAEESGEADKQPAQAGGDKVGDIIEAGADHADGPIFFVLIADHRIQGVDRFIGHRQRRAAQQQKEERRDNAVDGVLRDGFHHRAINLLRRKLRRVAPNDPRQLDTALRQIPRAQRALDVPRRLRQAASGQHGENHPYLNQPAKPRMNRPRQRQHAPADAPR